MNYDGVRPLIIIIRNKYNEIAHHITFAGGVLMFQDVLATAKFLLTEPGIDVLRTEVHYFDPDRPLAFYYNDKPLAIFTFDDISPGEEKQ